MLHTFSVAVASFCWLTCLAGACGEQSLAFSNRIMQTCSSSCYSCYLLLLLHAPLTLAELVPMLTNFVACSLTDIGLELLRFNFARLQNTRSQ